MAERVRRELSPVGQHVKVLMTANLFFVNFGVRGAQPSETLQYIERADRH